MGGRPLLICRWHGLRDGRRGGEGRHFVRVKTRAKCTAGRRRFKEHRRGLICPDLLEGLIIYELGLQLPVCPSFAGHPVVNDGLLELLESFGKFSEDDLTDFKGVVPDTQELLPRHILQVSLCFVTGLLPDSL